MKDVSDLETTQIHLYAAGQIPYKQILTRESVELIRNSFGFREPSGVPGVTELIFEGGKVNLGGFGDVTITRIHLGERRIILSVAGNSAAADQLFVVLRSMISGMEPARGFDKMNPITFKQETSCVARLDIGWEEFLNPRFVEFLKSTVTKAVS